MKVKVVAIMEMDFNNIDKKLDFDTKNHVIVTKIDKLISCGGGNCKEIYWEDAEI